MAGGAAPYKQGYRVEVKEREYWEAKGYWTLRRRASKGPYDVCAVSPEGDHTLFIEVKSFTGRKPSKSYKESIDAIKQIPAGPNVRRILAVWGRPKKGAHWTRWQVEVTDGMEVYQHGDSR